MPNCAVVVGAGTGTGAELSKLLAAEGYAVVLARRDAASLAPVAAEIEQRGGSAQIGIRTHPGAVQLPFLG